MKPALALALGLCLLAAPASAQTIHTCSGVGLDERESAERVPYTLRLEYAQADGHYLGGVDTVIADGAGNQVVAVRCPGPWVLVDLPVGRYRVTATLNGKPKSFGVTISGAKRVRQVVIF